RGLHGFKLFRTEITDEDAPLHRPLFLATDRALRRRLALGRGLGGGLRFLDLAFQPADLEFQTALFAFEFLDARLQAPGFAGARGADIVSCGPFRPDALGQSVPLGLYALARPFRRLLAGFAILADALLWQLSRLDS